MRKILSLLAVLIVAACASPTMKMSDHDISSLSDDQLCSYKNNYRSEPRLNAELARRNILPEQCNRFYRECLRRGNQPGTEAMYFCMDILRQNDRLRSYDPYWDNHFYHGRHRSGLRTGVGFGF
jgi:hypothetical protein